MKLSEDKRMTLWNKGRAIGYLFGSLFQNEMDLTPEMIDEELKTLAGHQTYIDNYTDELKRLKLKIID